MTSSDIFSQLMAMVFDGIEGIASDLTVVILGLVTLALIIFGLVKFTNILELEWSSWFSRLLPVSDDEMAEYYLKSMRDDSLSEFQRDVAKSKYRRLIRKAAEED